MTIFILSFMNMYSIYVCLGIIIGEVLEPYGYSDKETSLAGTVFILAGILGSFIVGVILDKT